MPHACPCTDASLGYGSAPCISNRLDSVLRSDVQATDVVQPCIGCFPNDRTEPRNGTSRGENGLDHVPDHPLVHCSHTQGIGEENWGFNPSELINQGQSCRRSRTIEGPRSSLDRVVVPIITRGQHRGDTSSNRPVPNPERPVTTDQCDVTDPDARDIRNRVVDARFEPANADIKVTRPWTVRHICLQSAWGQVRRCPKRPSTLHQRIKGIAHGVP